MQLRVFLFGTAAMIAVPAFPADAVKREPERTSPSQLAATPTGAVKPATPANAVPPPRKSGRVRYSIPPRTRM